MIILDHSAARRLRKNMLVFSPTIPKVLGSVYPIDNNTIILYYSYTTHVLLSMLSMSLLCMSMFCMYTCHLCTRISFVNNTILIHADFQDP